MKKITLVLFTLIFSLSLFSQNCVTDMSGGDFGLSSAFGEIVFLKVAPDTNKWFGIKNSFGGGYGIGKFDGSSWTAFTATNSDLPEDRVYDIAFDTSGNVWVANHLGLAKFDGDATTGWELYDNTDFGTTTKLVTAVAIDSGYVKWIGLQSGELIRYNDTTFTVVHQFVGAKINTINVDSSHNVWIGMNHANGLSMYDHAGFTDYFQYGHINSIQFRGTSHVYASDFNGLHIYNSAEWTDIPAPGFSLYHVAINKDEEVWLSSTNGLLQLKDGLFIPYTPLNSGLPNFALFSHPCSFDQDDKLWFSYVTSGSACGSGFFQENPGLGLEILSDNNFTFCEGDSTELDAGEGFATYVWSNGAITDSLVIYQSDTLNVAVSDGAGCWDYDTVTTIMQEVYELEKICVVTVIEGQNVVVWARTQDVGTEYYNVYKETDVADVYEIAGTVPFTLLSVFVDPDSETGTRSERYKIAAVDSCSNESEVSFHHKTMHLTINVGTGGETNLIWENYEGFDFGSYIIFRGTRVDNMVEFDTIPSNITTWTDLEVGEFYYKVGIVMPEVCSPALFLKAGAGPYSHSFSNEEARLQISAPPTDLSLPDSTILDDEPAGSYIGKFLTNKTDTLDYVYTLVAGEGDTDNGNFAISNDSLFSAIVLDYDIDSQLRIRVRTTDGDVDTLWLEETFGIHVLPIDNEKPTDITLDNDAVAEDQLIGTFIGKFSTTDPNVGDIHTYSLVAGDGSSDNASFTISGDSLFANQVFDYDIRTTYNIRVRSRDDGSGHKYIDEQFVINVTEVISNTEPSDITLSENSLVEQLAVGAVIGTFTTTDADAGDTHEYSLVSGTGDDDNASFDIVDNTLVSNEIFDYDTKNSFSIRIRSTDAGSLYFEKEFTILILETAIDDELGRQLKIYPVPMTDLLTVEFPYQSGQDYNLVITDLNGQRIKMINKINTGSLVIDASDLAPGIYILELRGPELLRARIVKTQ